jgi:hypothetical protein
MSLLANMLAQAKTPADNGRDVPPVLLEMVSNDRSRKRRLLPLVAAALILGLTVLGGGVLYLTKHLATMAQPAVTPLPARPSVAAAPPATTPAPATQMTANAAPKPKAPPIKVARLQERPTIPPAKRKRLHTQLSVKHPALIPLPPQPQPAIVPVAPTPPTIVTAKAADGEMEAILYAARHDELQGDFAAARLEYRKALRFRPQDPNLLNAISYLYLRERRYPEALDLARQALALDEGNGPALVNAGISQAALGNVSDAEAFLKRGVSSDHSGREALQNLALLYERQKRVNEALTTYRALVDRGEMPALLQVGRILESLGRTPEAITLYEEVKSSPRLSDQNRRQAADRLKALRPS